MASYFSQLAKNTGLTFGQGTSDANASANAPETAASQTHGELPSPLGIDEVTFTPPAAEPQPSEMTAKKPDLAGEASTSLPREGRSVDPGFGQQSSAIAAAEEVSDSQTSAPVEDIGTREVNGESGIGADNLKVSGSDLQAPSTANTPVHEQHLSHAAPDHQAAKFESQREPGKQPATSPRERDLGSITQRERLVTTLLGETPEETEQVTTMRDYLKEVLAWVAAPPERDERQSSSEALQPAIPERIEIQTKDEGLSPAQPATTEPMVQDFNLSIGSISIVVEEPRQNVAAQVVTPLRNDRLSEPATSEPTRLSRYYVRSW